MRSGSPARDGERLLAAVLVLHLSVAAVGSPSVAPPAPAVETPTVGESSYETMPDEGLEPPTRGL